MVGWLWKKKLFYDKLSESASEAMPSDFLEEKGIASLGIASLADSESL
jgi:hypothetical protein